MTEPTIKSHPLNISTRIIMVVPGIMLVIFFIFILSIPAGGNPSEGIWWSFLVIIGFGVITIYVGLTMRLNTSPGGVQYYYLYPLSRTFLWKELDSASQNNFGMVNIDIKIIDGKKDWLRIFSNNQLPLSSFIDDWQSSELISEIQKYAPHVQIPVGLLTQPKLKLWQRPGIMLIYYLFSLFFLLLLISLIGIEILRPIHFSLRQAVVGYETGTFGGMLSLLRYSEWLKSHTNKKFYGLIGKMARWNYILPFSGWGFAFLVGLIAQWTSLGWNYTGEENGLNAVIAIVCFYQIAFLPYIKHARWDR